MAFMDSLHTQLQQLFKEGSGLLQAGNAAEGLERFQAAREIDPYNPQLLLFAGAALHELKRYDEAISCYDQALQITPSMGEAHNNRGNSLLELGRFTEALDAFLAANRLLPFSPVPLTACATALQVLCRVSEAEECCRQALERDPDFAEAHWNLAIVLLMQGKFREGWHQYEWRWRKATFTSPHRHNDIPLWDGSRLEGKSILMHAEQGFGDAIQFVRYAPMVVKLGARVIIECHPELVSLFQEIEGVHTVIPFDGFCPPCDWQAPFLSLPRIFGTTTESIPYHTPYLTVPLDRKISWQKHMATYQGRLKIGLVWAGKNYPDPLRSCSLSDFAPLADGDAIFFSLQLGVGSEEATDPPHGMYIIDLTSHINDFADTAALIEQLDLVISIDTAVAHLAGALGKPVWLLLPFAPDWRWMLDRNDSPWYPSMRLFRQDRPREWGDVVYRVSYELMSFVKNQRRY